MTPRGFHHVAIQVRDVEQVAAFYVRVLGLTEVKRFHRDDGSLRSVWVNAGEGEAFFAIEDAPAHTPAGALGFSMVALRIEASARAAVIEALTRAGVAIEKQSGWTVYVRDPEGNLVGLSHHPEPAP